MMYGQFQENYMLDIYLLYPFFAIVLWAGNVIASKMAATEISPTAITYYRLILALSLLTPFILPSLIKSWRDVRPHLGKMFISGVLAMALFQSLSYRAAETSTATDMAIVTALIPMLTAILSVVLLREALTVGMVLGGSISLIGMLYLVGKGSMATLFSEGMHIGDLLMLLASLSYALYGVLLRKWKLTIPAWHSVYLQAIAALFVMTPMFLMLPAGAAPLDARTIPLIAYAAIGSSIMLSFCWILGVKHLGPNRCSIFINLLPLMTAVMAIFLLDERMHLYHLIGGGLSLLVY
jgi:drug/metabolite transporter (DMT)-like permease